MYINSFVDDYELFGSWDVPGVNSDPATDDLVKISIVGVSGNGGLLAFPTLLVSVLLLDADCLVFKTCARFFSSEAAIL